MLPFIHFCLLVFFFVSRNAFHLHEYCFFFEAFESECFNCYSLRNSIRNICRKNWDQREFFHGQCSFVLCQLNLGYITFAVDVVWLYYFRICCCYLRWKKVDSRSFSIYNLWLERCVYLSVLSMHVRFVAFYRFIANPFAIHINGNVKYRCAACNRTLIVPMTATF